ncbi:MAG: hypothetical protein MUC29_10215 [Pyrinomonadaceae bacterium]|nr:hypothetical protein [Pyrinomonadaceae bacterium]
MPSFANNVQRRYDIAVLRIFFKTILFVIFTVSAFAQQRPLLTDDVDITPTGSMRISLATEFTQNEKFPVSGLKGDQTKVGLVDVRVGINSNVEIQVSGTLQNYLSVNSASPSNIPLNINNNSSNDYGDFTVATKIKIRNESKNLPAFGVKFGFQVPASDQSKGIGLNQVNIFGKVLMQKGFGKLYGKQRLVNVYGNLGLGIFPSPLANFSQNDMFLYGIGSNFRVNKRINIVGEFNGKMNTRPTVAPIGTESSGQVRIGTQIKASGLRFDTAAIIGTNKFSPRSGVTFGVTYTSPSLFKPAQ